MPKHRSDPSPASRPPLPSRFSKVFALLIAAVIGLHFLTIWLYLTPNNPLKLALWNPIHSYVHPLFAQNWQLFAPNPIAHDETMHLKVRWREAGSEKIWETDWLDITTPIFQKIHRTRIGPYSKMARPYTGVKESLDFTEPVASALRERTRIAFQQEWEAQIRNNPPRDSASRRIALQNLAATLDSIDQPSIVERAQRKAGREMAYRLGSANARQAIGTRGEVVAINIRYAMHEFPRFSERKNPEAQGRTRYTRPFGWEPPRPGITLPE
jgi:hypothetical protein